MKFVDTVVLRDPGGKIIGIEISSSEGKRVFPQVSFHPLLFDNLDPTKIYRSKISHHKDGTIISITIDQTKLVKI